MDQVEGQPAELSITVLEHVCMTSTCQVLAFKGKRCPACYGSSNDLARIAITFI